MGTREEAQALENAYVIALLFELRKNGVSTKHIALAYEGMGAIKPNGAKSLVSGEYGGVTFDVQRLRRDLPHAYM